MAYWRLLLEGGDAISEVPPSRWPIESLYDPDPLAPGRMSTRWGGFLDEVDRFDAPFFGMSPREAAQTDPQQRLALELAWEALEDAGIRPSRLLGGRTGVFVGAMWSDYARLMSGPEAIVQHTATGQDISIVSARVAYALGLQGPALTVSTACSSALVAVHLACASLRRGESRLALAGGVHLLLAPESSIAMTKFGAMAPDGRCKAFDARANGYVRGEGGGLVLLRPLSEALAAGDRIYAVIRGGAVNNDGPSNGLTAPNPLAQRAMLEDALVDAGLSPAGIDYVEAHGTGTALGDPIEAQALAAVLCRGRPPERRLRIGSAKTNIGHLEAAAGAAGLIKLALALHHRWIPSSLHYQRPNPAIPFGRLKLEVQAEGSAWPEGQGHAPAGGVSSFGFGGTNCHLILQAAPAVPEAAQRPVFVFAGNGGNWPGMGRDLAQAFPVFRHSLDASDATLAHLGYGASVLALLTAEDPSIEAVALGQPALCAFQLALVDLLAELGLRPACVIGHSVGEVAAAAAAGHLTREAALAVVVARSRLQERVAGQGTMALAAAPAAAVAAHLGAEVVVAGENGPRATLLSGTAEALRAACSRLDAVGIVAQPVRVPVAYHGPQMDPLRPLLEAELATLAPGSGPVPMVSTVTGAEVAGTALDACYWASNMREPVRFRQGVASLLARGHHAFIEIAPHPLLAAQLRQMAPPQSLVVSPLSRGAPVNATALRECVAPLLTGGPRDGERPRHLLLLSARSAAALDALVHRWAERLPESFVDLCHTALVGRECFAHRLALHAADGEEARARLLSGAGVLRGCATGATLPCDAVRRPGEGWEAWLDRCATAFVAGAEIDPVQIEAGGSYRIVSAPTYPFERERHWLPEPAEALHYDVAWQSWTGSAAVLPTVDLSADPVDAGLEAEATALAHAALATLPPGSSCRAIKPLRRGWRPGRRCPAASRARVRRRNCCVGSARPCPPSSQVPPIRSMLCFPRASPGSRRPFMARRPSPRRSAPWPRRSAASPAGGRCCECLNSAEALAR
jgi:acyl transferase domain-containing protein